MNNFYSFLLCGLFSLIMLFSSSVFSAEPIQSQISLNGDFDVNVIIANVNEDVLKIVVMVKNTTVKEKKFYSQIEKIFYIVKSEGKKYHVLKDSANTWLADPMYYQDVKVTVAKGARSMFWVKFPAPAESINSIDLTIQSVLPFDNLAITR